jgi:hypothetical protein
MESLVDKFCICGLYFAWFTAAVIVGRLILAALIWFRVLR